MCTILSPNRARCEKDQETGMATTDPKSALAQDLSEAIDELHGALTRAADAATRLKALVPRVGAVSGMLGEIEALLRGARLEDGERTAPESITRPTLLVSDASPAIAATPIESAQLLRQDEPAPQQSEPQPIDTSELVCFRLEFQNSEGPLDLRAVDDAVGEHPAVRDVALIDYDGRNATLKVWIIASASPADVERALNERASQIFPDGSQVTIIALEDAA
jgi:hypothetical protein